LPGGSCTHWKAPPLHGARQKQTSTRHEFCNSRDSLDQKVHRHEALFLRHARGVDCSGPAAFERSLEHFRKDMRRLIAEFGQAAVDGALDDMPDESWPSVSLH
jgi:hypothetical protein